MFSWLLLEADSSSSLFLSTTLTTHWIHRSDSLTHFPCVLMRSLFRPSLETSTPLRSSHLPIVVAAVQKIRRFTFTPSSRLFSVVSMWHASESPLPRSRLRNTAPLPWPPPFDQFLWILRCSSGLAVLGILWCASAFGACCFSQVTCPGHILSPCLYAPLSELWLLPDLAPLKILRSL